MTMPEGDRQILHHTLVPETVQCHLVMKQQDRQCTLCHHNSCECIWVKVKVKPDELKVQLAVSSAHARLHDGYN